MANYPVPYQNNWAYGSGIGSQLYPQYQQTYAQQAQTPQPTATQGTPGMIWVDGEIGAKAYQLPAGWPANQPVALWDTNDTVIYLKSVNPMGMPAPLQRAHYTLEGMKSGEKTTGYSGDEKRDMSEFVRKEDLERMKQDLIDTIGQMSTSGTGVKRTVKGEA